MSSISWTASASGSWSTGANWSTGAAPLRGDDVTINTATSLTVTYATASLTLDSLSTTNAGLDITAGTLAVQNGYNFGGALAMGGGLLRLAAGAGGDVLGNAVSQSGGTLVLVGASVAAQISNFGTLQQSAGTIDVRGIFTDAESNSTLSGTISGGGTINFASGTTNFNTGLTLSIANTEITGGTVNLNASISDARNFQLGGNAVLNLNNRVLTLSGTGALYGVVTNGGTVTESGHGILNGLTLDNGAEVNITSRTVETGTINLGAIGSGVLLVSKNGTLVLDGNASINNTGGGGTLTNNGLVTKVGGSSISGTAVIASAVINTGTINANSGTIDFRGPNSSAQVSQIGGSLTGAGSVVFDQGYFALGLTSLTTAHTVFAGSSNVTLTTALSYAGNWDQFGGLLLFENNLTLSGVDAFDGGEVKGTATINFAAGSTLHLGNGMDLEGNLAFVMNGPVTQTGSINIGALSDSVDQVTLTAGNDWVLEGVANISGAFGTITNGGLFEKLDGAQNSFVASDFVNSDSTTSTAAGTLLVDSGTLSLIGHGMLGGVVSGAAVLDIAGAFAFGSGLALSVGELILDNGGLATLNSDLAYGQDWASEGGTVALNGDTLTLTGIASLAAGAFSGTGLVDVTGSAVIGQANGSNAFTYQLAQGANLIVAGQTEQAGDLLMTSGASSPTLTIGSTGTYSLDSGVYIGAAPNTPSSGTVVNDGQLNASAYGLTSINASLVNAGTITLNYGEMRFLGPVSGHGLISVANGGTLDINTSSLVQSAISFGGGGGVLSLGSPSAFTGTIRGFSTGDVVELQNFAFTTTPLVISGNTVTINEPTGSSVTLTFSTAQTGSLLLLGEGPHGGVALIHL